MNAPQKDNQALLRAARARVAASGGAENLTTAFIFLAEEHGLALPKVPTPEGRFAESPEDHHKRAVAYQAAMRRSGKPVTYREALLHIGASDSRVQDTSQLGPKAEPNIVLARAAKRIAAVEGIDLRTATLRASELAENGALDFAEPSQEEEMLGRATAFNEDRKRRGLRPLDLKTTLHFVTGGA